MRDLQEILVDPDYAGLRPAPSATELSTVERVFGRQLPKNYVHFLSVCNGGHTELDTVIAQSGEWSIDHFLAVTDDQDYEESVVSNLELWRDELGNSALPIAYDGGSNPFFLDFASNPPSVWIYLRDEGGIRSKVSNSLEELIDKLQRNPNNV
ncbi:MAG: SMI1/KNR4 family protein [Deltaproteobacteria bacterium]|nr:SMI1/KNR4 family protein [Deltaproteobacteria bacterium]